MDMVPLGDSWLSPKAQKIGSVMDGFGIAAVEPIEALEVIAVWGGHLVSRSELDQMPGNLARNSVQVGIDRYLVPRRLSSGDHVNHSCQPNAGIRGMGTLIAMRAIRPGEEITYDYAMTDDSDYDQFSCLCGAETCRGQVTGGDWRLLHLQRQYRGFFSDFIQVLIERQQV